MNTSNLLLVGLVLFLPCCSGGGDEPTAFPAAITTQNALAVVDVVFGGTADAYEAASLISDSLDAFDGNVGTISCEGGGTASAATAGESVTFSFDQCFEDGTRTNGTMTAVLVAASATELTFAITIHDMTFQNGAVSASVDGDLTIGVRDLGGDFIWGVGRGRRLTVASGGRWRRIEDYEFADTTNVITGAYTAERSARIVDSDLGVVYFETVEPLRGTHPGNPTEGRILVRGASGSTLIVVAEGARVRIEVDGDGDGTFEHTIATNWAALLDE